MNAGSVDFKDQFDDITRTILSNQTESLKNLTDKVQATKLRDDKASGIKLGCLI